MDEYELKHECLEYFKYLTQEKVEKCCNEQCSNIDDLTRLSENCLLCSHHFDSFSKDIKKYHNDKNITFCRTHNSFYDTNILNQFFQIYSRETNKSKINYMKSQPKFPTIKTICILDESHEAKLVKKNEKTIYITCDTCWIRICCFCGSAYSEDHNCEVESDENYSENFENRNYKKCYNCKLFNYPQSEFVKCVNCSNEVCASCLVPSYLVKAHGKCMHTCEDHISSNAFVDYNEECLTCLDLGYSCFKTYINQKNKY